jgi:hypothetical protein
VLYGLVRQHLASFLRHTAEAYDKPLPAYVEREFRAYLRCDVFAHGFVRAAAPCVASSAARLARPAGSSDMGSRLNGGRAPYLHGHSSASRSPWNGFWFS